MISGVDCMALRFGQTLGSTKKKERIQKCFLNLFSNFGERERERERPQKLFGQMSGDMIRV